MAVYRSSLIGQYSNCNTQTNNRHHHCIVITITSSWFRSHFHAMWGTHRCEVKGCGEWLTCDGGMKPRRYFTEKIMSGFKTSLFTAMFVRRGTAEWSRSNTAPPGLSQGAQRSPVLAIRCLLSCHVWQNYQDFFPVLPRPQGRHRSCCPCRAPLGWDKGKTPVESIFEELRSRCETNCPVRCSQSTYSR